MLTSTIATNTDDFLIRMLKGCIQLQSAPIIANTVNMVPVDHVARVVVSCAFHPSVNPLGVAQVTGHPRMTLTEFGESLAEFGYQVAKVDYESWRKSLETYVEDQTKATNAVEEHALMPLYHFVIGKLSAMNGASYPSSALRVLDTFTIVIGRKLTDPGNLPAGTKAPELSDTNTAAALRADAARTGKDWSAGAGVTMDLMGIYLAYLVAIGFLPPPNSAGRPLPAVHLTDLQRESLSQVGGRGVGRADPKAI